MRSSNKWRSDQIEFLLKEEMHGRRTGLRGEYVVADVHIYPGIPVFRKGRLMAPIIAEYL